MARYFFNVHDGISLIDTVGSEHPDVQSARHEAVETIAERLKGALLKDADISAWLMNVTDERGFTVIVCHSRPPLKSWISLVSPSQAPAHPRNVKTAQKTGASWPVKMVWHIS